MSLETDTARDQLTNQVLDATTLPEIEGAREALRAWIKQHPEDGGMRDAFEQLAMMQEIAETESDAPKTATAGERKAA